MIAQETFSLANGVKVPKLGLGTWMISQDDAKQAVLDALAIGYRHIDTAQDYGNEAQVADGIKASGLNREDIFVTTKLAAAHKTYDDAKQAINASFKRMGLDYIDLVIIHSPQPWGVFGGEDRFFEGNLAAWKALEEFYQAGKIRAIGLSNFQQVDIENIISHCSVKPMVNQILAHITNIPDELVEYSKSHGLLVEAYSPMGHGELFKNPEIQKIADKYKVSLPQLCIRFALQLGLLPLPKTANPTHMKNNSELDFVISNDDMTFLHSLPKIEDYGDHSVFPVYQ